MAYDEEQAAKVRELISVHPDVTERKMFGGIGWMVNGNMAAGVMSSGGILIRMEPEEAEAAWRLPNARPFGREGAKPMKGFAIVDPADDADLERWIEAGVGYAASLPPK